MTGKLADTVMSVRNGEQIARKYQPIVFNPSTPAQVAQRAKLKLISQLSAVMAPYIAIRKQGSVSSRNLFTKKNFPLASYNNDTAQITLEQVQLTDSVVGLPAIDAVRTGSSIAMNLGTDVADVDRVVYVAIAKSGNTLRAVASAVAQSADSSASPWPATLEVGTNAEVYVYAYGIRFNSEYARVRFGNLGSPAAEQVAKLIVESVLSESDVTLTETKSLVVAAPNRDGGDSGEVEKKTRKK